MQRTTGSMIGEMADERDVPLAESDRLPGIIVAITLFLITAAVNLQVPLYQTYADAAGYGGGPTAVAFAAYVGGLLPVLILLGGISDRIGRKPVMLAGLIAASSATALMLRWPDIHALFAARILQGVGVGLSVGAGTAYLAERFVQADGPTRAASYAAVTTSVGFGSGALFTSAALLYRHSLTPLSFWVVLLPTLGCIVFVARLPQPRALARATSALVRLPHFPAGTLAYSFAIGTAWAVTGLVIAIVPTELRRHALASWSGVALFLVNGTGAACQPLARRMKANTALRTGLLILPVGYALLVVGASRGALIVVLAGAAVAGAACYGFTYLGGLNAVSQAAGADRARAVSGYFLFAYLGFGIPSVCIGFLADRFGVVSTLAGFGVIVLAASIALLLRLRRGQ